MSVKANYYLDNTRCDTDEVFPFSKTNGIIQFDLFNWGHLSVELSTATNPPRGDYIEGDINHTKFSIF